MKWGKSLTLCRQSFLSNNVFSSSKRMIFAKISLLDHLCDPNQYPVWHSSIPKELRMLPEINQAITEFQQARWANSLACLERSMEIIESIPAMQQSGLHVFFGQLHCALEGNWHLIFPSKWKVLAQRALESIDFLLHSGVNVDDSVYAKWISIAALFVKGNESPHLRKRIDSYVKVLKDGNAKCAHRTELVNSFVYLKAAGEGEVYPVAFSVESQKAFPGFFTNNTLSTAGDLSTLIESETLLDILALISAESFRDPSATGGTSSDPIFQTLFSQQVANLTLSPRQEKIHDMLTQIVLKMHGIQSLEGLVEAPIVSGKSSRIPSHLFISMCLSVRNCPVKLLQCALRHSKAISDDDAETRNILIAMCLRALALHYQYNYIYFSGLYNSAIGYLENWLRQAPGGSRDTLEQTVNRLMRGEYVRLLRDLGQNKEAESLERRYKLA